MPKVLLALTSYHDHLYPSGRKTGIFLLGVLEPFKLYKKHGFEVDFVSETGTCGVDELSIQSEYFPKEDREYLSKHADCEFRQMMKHIKHVDQIKADDYDIFFACAGHGALFDFPNSKLLKIAETMYNHGKIIATICQSAVIFDGLMDLYGTPIIEGRSITGLPNIGQKLLLVDEVIRRKNLFTVPEVAERMGAKYLTPVGPFTDFSIADGRIITGANFKSSNSAVVRTIMVYKELRDLGRQI